MKSKVIRPGLAALLTLLVVLSACGAPPAAPSAPQGGGQPASVAPPASGAPAPSSGGSAAQPGEVFKWRMQSLYPGGHIYQKESADYFAGVVKRLSGGRLDISSFGSGALVPFGETTDAVSKGMIEASIWWPAYDMGKDPVAALFGTVPMGFTEHEYYVWVNQGEGQALLQEFYDRYNIKAMLAGVGFSQIFGHFKKPVGSLEEMRGLTVRLSGIQAEIVKEFGVKVQFLAAADIYTALERGIIDMAEFSGPSWNWDAGFHEVGKYVLLPGWHEPSSLITLIINKDAWNKLPDDLKYVVEMSAEASYAHVGGFIAKDDAVALRKMKDYGVEFRRLSDKDLAALDEATQKVLNRYAEKDPFFAKVLKSIRDFKALLKEREVLTDLSYKK